MLETLFDKHISFPIGSLRTIIPSSHIFWVLKLRNILLGLSKIPDTFVSGILFLFQMGFLDSLILNYFASVPKLAFYERVFEQIYGLFRDSPPLSTG